MPSEQDLLIISLVNEARNNPRLAAEKLGFDVDEIISTNPEMGRIFDSRLPLIFYDKRLGQAAQARAQELGKQYKDNGSFEEFDACYRQARESGYEAYLCHDETGFLLFDGYIEQEQALMTLFEYALKSEIAESDVDSLRILDPNIRDGGAGLIGARLSQNSRQVNAYILVLFLGGDYLLDLENQLIKLVNLTRAHPIVALEVAGIDIDEAIDKLGNDAWVLNGLDKVTRSSGLTNFCRFEFVSSDFTERNRLDINQLNGVYLRVPSKINGYRFSNLTTHGPSIEIFAEMVISEVINSHSSGLFMLNPDIAFTGMAFNEKEVHGEKYLEIMFCSSND